MLLNRPDTLKITLHVWEAGPPSNTGFPGPNQVHIPNGISISSAVFAGLTIVTDRLTDRPTDYATPSIAIDCI